MQILHAGRYAFHENLVSASAMKAPINIFKPRALSEKEIEEHISDYVNCACLAQQAGYDGVEIMGSEGYLINQFIVSKTNNRTDDWGGSFENRIRFPVEIISRVRKKVGPDFIIIYRLSMIDLVKNGSSWEEVVRLAKNIEQAGASIINTGIGWHEARVPTIATLVPRAAFTWVTAKLKGRVSLPLVTSNRINTPEQAELGAELPEGAFTAAELAELERLTDSLPAPLREFRALGLLSAKRRFYLEQAIRNRTLVDQIGYSIEFDNGRGQGGIAVMVEKSFECVLDLVLPACGDQGLCQLPVRRCQARVQLHGPAK